MIKPLMTTDEDLRLKELISLELLDTTNEKEFDDIVALAAYISGCPISLVSLVDIDRQWFKAKHGLDAVQTHRDISFCGHAIHDDKPLIVENTLIDKRFKDNPLVTEDPSIRFYAGQPLITSNGYKIGTLCIIDRVPRTLSEEQIRHLGTLARQVIALMELRMTNRRQALEALTQNQFLANMSHEIRTPLTGILGYASIAKSTQLKDGSNPKLQGYLDSIERQSKHVLAIAGNILDLSKIDSTKIELDPTTMSTADLKAHIVSLFELEAKRKKIELTFNISTDVPDFVIVDSTRLKQIATNIVGNAVKFTTTGSVSTQLDYDKSTEKIIISVEDTGVGISEVQRLRLFKPFSQADSSIHTKYGGTGLGLVLSRQIAQAMSGTLELAASRPNEGSLFIATVKAPPVVGTVAEQAKAAAAEADSIYATLKSIGGHVSVLIADDAEDTRVIFSHYLKQFGIVADESGTGTDVLYKLSKQPYDVVFLDLEMPHLNGFETIKKIRDTRVKTKVIAFTAYNSKEYRDKTKAAGFNGFLAKPIEPTDVGRILIEAIVGQN